MVCKLTLLLVNIVGVARSYRRHVMHSGKHYAEFMIEGQHAAHWTYPQLYLGVVRPSCRPEGSALKEREKQPTVSPPPGVDGVPDQSCWFDLWKEAGTTLYRTADGAVTHAQDGSAQNWEGQQRATRGDTVGLLLDLDEGSITVFKNGAYLGVGSQPGDCKGSCVALATRTPAMLLCETARTLGLDQHQSHSLWYPHSIRLIL